MLLKLGFAVSWVETVTNVYPLFHTLSYLMVRLQVTFPPTRGLRPGDPLSPYLFMICAEGLMGLFENFERRGLINGVSICRGVPAITQLLFADDSFLFLPASF